MKSCQQQEISLIVVIDTRNSWLWDLVYLRVMYDGLGNETAALILNITAILKEVSSTLKLEKLLYNTALIKMPYIYYSWIILNSFYNWLFPKLFRHNRRMPMYALLCGPY